MVSNDIFLSNEPFTEQNFTIFNLDQVGKSRKVVARQLSFDN